MAVLCEGISVIVLEYGSVGVGENPEDKVAMCWLYEGSMRRQFTFAPMEDLEDRLEFLRSEGDLDVYRDSATDKEVFVGRSGRTPKTVN